MSMIVTIANRYGCGALEVGRGVALSLGYEFVDEQLPVVVAKRLKTSPEAVESAEETGTSVGSRVLRVLELGTPEVGGGVADAVSFDEECLQEVRQAVREFAARGNVVIFGRGANAIVGRRPDALRIFMHAPRDWRIERITAGLGVDRATATAEIDRIDRAREAYMRAYYDISWGDTSHYDITIDTANFGLAGAAALVVRAVELRA